MGRIFLRILRVAAVAAVAVACQKQKDDVPPPPNVSGGLRASPTTTLTLEPGQPSPPQPAAAPRTDQRPVATAAQPSPAPITPFTIPWPKLPPGLPQIPWLAAPDAAPSAGPSTAPAQIPDSRVIVYATKWCVNCTNLENELTRRGVPFVVVDLEDQSQLASPAGAHAREIPPEMRKGVPVTRVVQKNGQPTWIQGDAPDAVERAYRGA